MPSTARHPITRALRLHQCNADLTPELFTALHTFTIRTADEFFIGFDLPYPCLSLAKGEGNYDRGFYVRTDGYGLPWRINLNPWAHKTGADLAETLVHELTHLWQDYVNLPVSHGSQFRTQMRNMGLTCDELGIHVHMHGEWVAWLEENKDLALGNFLLPGSAKRPSDEVRWGEEPVA